MSRHALTLPARFDFATDITVQARDINYGGHLGHDAAVSLLHETRGIGLGPWAPQAAAEPASGGTVRRTVGEAGHGGAGLIMLELDVRYGAEAFWGERLRVEMAVSGPGAARCEFLYRVDRGGTEVLRARTLMGFFDYAARRLVRRPADFLNRLTTFAQERTHV